MAGRPPRIGAAFLHWRGSPNNYRCAASTNPLLRARTWLIDLQHRRTNLEASELDFRCSTVATAGFTTHAQGPQSFSFENQSAGATTYLWEFGDGNTSTEQSPEHTYAENGDYQVCLYAEGECGRVSACQTVSVTVGIAERDATGLPILFPSPATDRFVVQSTRTAIKELVLLDTDGRIVRRIDQLNAHRAEIPVAGLAHGVYIARVMLMDNTLFNLRGVVAE